MIVADVDRLAPYLGAARDEQPLGGGNVTYWVSLVVLYMRSNNVIVAAAINSASCYSSVVTQQ
jgi:hypothetical protein